MAAHLGSGSIQSNDDHGPSWVDRILLAAILGILGFIAWNKPAFRLLRPHMTAAYVLVEEEPQATLSLAGVLERESYIELTSLPPKSSVAGDETMVLLDDGHVLAEEDESLFSR